MRFATPVPRPGCQVAVPGASQRHATRVSSRAVHSRAFSQPGGDGQTSSMQDQIPPPPPPPPPPPRFQNVDRRGVLTIVATTGGGVLLGFLLGRRGLSDPEAVDSPESKELDEQRRKMHFRRDFDGHVWVQGKGGRWSELRLDPQVPGTLLLRDPDGYVSTMTLGVQQVDLTSDYVMAAIFGEGTDWEQSITRLRSTEEDGRSLDVRLDQDAFRDIISILQ